MERESRSTVEVGSVIGKERVIQIRLHYEGKGIESNITKNNGEEKK